MLKKDLPVDALARVGVTMEDLYVSDLNFVFGLGSPQLKAGIYSLYRYGGGYRGARPYNTRQRRALKVMAHEIGHIFYIKHCIFYSCGMNGSNSLTESDGRPLAICPVDERKLRHFLGYNREERYRKLEQFYRENGMDHDADHVNKIRESLKRKPGNR